MEKWKKIKNWDIYEISNCGNVRSISRKDKVNRIKTNRLLKKNINNFGYEYVSFYYNGKSQKKLVHRLVAEAFLPKSEEKNIINHKDGNKLNNCVDNLEWCTQKENIIHSWNNKLSHRTRCKKIRQYDLKNNFIKEYNAVMDAERETKINNSKIVACCKNHYGRKSAGGYIWRYADENNN